MSPRHAGTESQAAERLRAFLEGDAAAAPPPAEDLAVIEVFAASTGQDRLPPGAWGRIQGAAPPTVFRSRVRRWAALAAAACLAIAAGAALWGPSPGQLPPPSLAELRAAEAATGLSGSAQERLAALQAATAPQRARIIRRLAAPGGHDG